MPLPVDVPNLAGATIIVTGSGQRLRDILDDPMATLACLLIDGGGKTARIFTSNRRRFRKVTSEFNSHLAVHADCLRATGGSFLALVHAQPLHLTYLSHIPRYQDQQYLNKRLLGWQPETIMNLPEGMGMIPYCVPGSFDLMVATVQAMRDHKLVIWSNHGVMVRSENSVLEAVDEVEYAETAARYEYLDLCAGEKGERLSAEDLRRICTAANIPQKLF
jgi:rhamnulose-1-phosphate aldolase